MTPMGAVGLIYGGMFLLLWLLRPKSPRAGGISRRDFLRGRW